MLGSQYYRLVRYLVSALVFIDGNNLYHNLKASGVTPSDIDLAKLSSYACDHFSAVAKRTHYYNSVPSMELGQEKYLKHRDFIEDIKRLPNFEVKTRKLQKQSNGRRIAEKLGRVNQTGYCKNCVHLAEEECKSCVGDFSMKEKGIDVMIAIDMLNLCAVENECEMCILISGDADFIPALDIIRAKGKKVASAFIFHGYSAELRQKHEFFCMDMDHLKDKCARS